MNSRAPSAFPVSPYLFSCFHHHPLLFIVLLCSQCSLPRLYWAPCSSQELMFPELEGGSTFYLSHLVVFLVMC